MRLYVVAGDWRLPDWTYLADANMALQNLLHKAGRPRGLLKLLQDGMGRLKRLQRLEGNGVPEAVREFKAGYKNLQVR